jgi:hypothetical protein
MPESEGWGCSIEVKTIKTDRFRLVNDTLFGKLDT